MKSTDFVVARHDFQQCKFIETAIPDAAQLPEGALLLKVDRFAFTANNITYAVLGDELKYWELFPAPEGFGNIPVWGFGEVVASRHPDIAIGERLFGYFPMATHLMIEAADVSKRGLRDAAAHRQNVAPVYNAYARVSGDPAYAGRQGDYQALLRPLFMLSFLVDDFLSENEFYGARRVMLSSASSKTAFGLAHLLHIRKDIQVIGLTSSSNVGFVKSLGCYDEIVTYDDVTSLPADIPVAFVDMAGNSALREQPAPAFPRTDEIFRTYRLHPSQHVARRAGTARREADGILRARPDPQTCQAVGTGRHREKIQRGVVGLCPDAGKSPRYRRRPRTGRRAAGLSRYAGRPYSAGSGPHAVLAGLRRFLRDGKAYSVATEETPRRRPSARSRMLDKTEDISVAADNWLAQFEDALATAG